MGHFHSVIVWGEFHIGTLPGQTNTLSQIGTLFSLNELIALIDRTHKPAVHEPFVILRHAQNYSCTFLSVRESLEGLTLGEDASLCVKDAEAAFERFWKTS